MKPRTALDVTATTGGKVTTETTKPPYAVLDISHPNDAALAMLRVPGTADAREAVLMLVAFERGPLA